MLRFNRITVFLKRPITVISVSDALGMKSFELADKAPKRKAFNFRTHFIRKVSQLHLALFQYLGLSPPWNP